MADRARKPYASVLQAWPLVIAWIVWSVYAVHAFWSSSPAQVFPLFAPVAPDGKPQRFDLSHVPSDRYRISIGIENDIGDHNGDKFALVSELENSNPVTPMRLNLKVIDEEDEEVILRYAGSTEDWFIGTRPAYDPSTTFDDMVFLFQSLEFDAQVLSEYTLEISLTTENTDILGKQLFILVSGGRTVGYYPIQKNVLILVSFVGLCLLTLLLTLRRLVKGRDQS
jgi:hypothetical protein